MDNPGRAQHLVEVIFTAIQGLMKEVIGREYRRFTPLIITLAVYILIGNLLGMVPGFISPTSNFNITASMGLCVFMYYNYQGFRKQGFVGYLKHFCGPVIWLAPLLFVIELISHLARPFSLSVRLFGNIFAEELIIGSLNQFVSVSRLGRRDVPGAFAEHYSVFYLYFAYHGLHFRRCGRGPRRKGIQQCTSLRIQ